MQIRLKTTRRWFLRVSRAFSSIATRPFWTVCSATTINNIIRRFQTAQRRSSRYCKNLSPDFKYQPGVVAADGDYVMVHGRYVGWGPKPMVGVDIFRVANGKIAEHWDVLQEEVAAAQSANGNAMFTGPQA